MKTLEIRGQNSFDYHSYERVACRAVIIKGDMILLSYAKNEDTYMLPGGGLEGNESDIECIKREVEEETGNVIETKECVLEVDEYYEDYKYISKYFIANIVGEGKRHLTPLEVEVELQPVWMKISKALLVFMTHESYRDKNEMKRGLYLRELTALKEILKSYGK